MGETPEPLLSHYRPGQGSYGRLHLDLRVLCAKSDDTRQVELHSSL